MSNNPRQSEILRVDNYPFFIRAVDHYHSRVEELKGTFPIELLYFEVLKWLRARVPILVQDQDIEKAKVLTVNEAGETREERTKEGTSLYDKKANVIEPLDVLFVLISMLVANNIPVDAHEVRARLNGDGKRSDIIDKMIEAAGNIDPRNVRRDSQHVIQLALSYLAGLPHSFDPYKSIEVLMEKDRRNYPKEAFRSHDEKGRPHTRGELHAIETHSRKSLRLIRKVTPNSTYGLPPEAYLPHLGLIQDFRNGPLAYAVLEATLSPPKTTATGSILLLNNN